jgi:oligoribonuclease (3'-5' exoribonuclease)
VTIAWIDFETNDLDPRTCTPIEVACIITDDAFKEIERYHGVIYWDRAAKVLDWLANGVEAGLNNLKNESRVEYLARKRGSSACGFWVDPIVIDMHLQNGLWKESVTGAALDTVDRELSDFIARHACKPPLAGSSVWYDREVIRNHMPRTFAALHYRTIDVSTIIEVSKRTWPTVETSRPTARKHHRAMTDIEDSLELMRYYTQALGPRPRTCRSSRPTRRERSGTPTTSWTMTRAQPTRARTVMPFKVCSSEQGFSQHHRPHL